MFEFLKRFYALFALWECSRCWGYFSDREMHPEKFVCRRCAAELKEGNHG
jgi:formylmethanofuran dehydrogenase subunit E